MLSVLCILSYHFHKYIPDQSQIASDSPVIPVIIIQSYENGFAKTDLKGTSTKIHFIPTHESYTHALSRNTKCLAMDG